MARRRQTRRIAPRRWRFLRVDRTAVPRWRLAVAASHLRRASDSTHKQRVKYDLSAPVYRYDYEPSRALP